MKGKVLNFLVILSSLFGYLEWGIDKHQFLFQIEGEIISKIFTAPLSVIHPFVLIPLLGQLLLIISLFQKKPNKILTLIGVSAIGILLVLIFAIGCMNLNSKILGSTVPFLIVAFLSIRNHLKRDNSADR